jgi:hypothetical protein
MELIKLTIDNKTVEVEKGYYCISCSKKDGY